MTNHDETRVVFPAFFREQFRGQFGKILGHELPWTDSNQLDASLEEIWNAFEAADRIIGEHWPLLATSLWQYGSHKLISTFIETSANVATALKEIMSEETAYLPVFCSSLEAASEGMVARVAPSIEVSRRNWDIILTLFVLGQTAFFKRHAPEETKRIVFRTCIPKSSHSETLQQLATSKILFDQPFEQCHVVYPFDLLSKSVGYRNDSLNKILLTEIRRIAHLPRSTNGISPKLRTLLRNSMPLPLSAEDAATKLGMSRSSMHRHLGSEGLSYKEVLHQERREYLMVHLSYLNHKDLDHEALGFGSRRALNDFCNTHLGRPLRTFLKKRQR